MPGREDGPVLLLTTQGLETSRLVEFLRVFLQSIHAQVPVRLVIKLHPQHDARPSFYRDAFSAFGNRVLVIDGCEEPSTFELLSRAHLHVSIASACHYDAVGLGVPTIILPFQTHEVVLPLLRSGAAWLATTPADLADLVAGWRALKVPPGTSERYFRPGALARVRAELGQLPPASRTRDRRRAAAACSAGLDARLA